MIVAVLVFFLLSIGSEAACLPDSLVFSSKELKIEMKVMEETVEKFESVMVRELPAHQDLIIRLDALNPRVNAEVVKDNGHVAISVWGGMLAHPKMNPPTLLLLLCHELGHLLGGPPLKSSTGWSSTEGQADYYSTHACIKNLGLDEGQFIDAALALTAIYAEVVKQTAPRLDRCDQTIVSRINYGYPGVQCRLDTMLSGWKQIPRPKCWFMD